MPQWKVRTWSKLKADSWHFEKSGVQEVLRVLTAKTSYLNHEQNLIYEEKYDSVMYIEKAAPDASD